MAIMIPATVSKKTPMSERKIFDRIRLDPGASDWVVMHSLGLKRTNIGPYGEIDIVVLVPGKGIACLEVKGGEVSCKDGVWRTRNRKTGNVHDLNKSPYLQAREGMFALKKAMTSKFGNSHPASKCALSYAVVFPDVHAPPTSTEAEDWETIDVASLRKPISELILGNISASKSKLPKGVRNEKVSAETIGEIRQFLRPDFEMVISRSTTISRSEEQIVSLTEEQYNYLDIASVNDRALVTGAAGTGKTLLALEFARREVQSGKNVLLLCYNKILSSWLGKVITDEGLAGISVSHLHSFLMRVIRDSSYIEEFEEKRADSDEASLYGDLFPFYSELALGECDLQFDTLIVDEAQDIISAGNLPVLNHLVKGGLAGGRWALFGDFTRQAIYGNLGDLKGGEQVRELILEHCQMFPVVPLKINCRNTRQIGEETALLSGFDSPPYKLGQADGLPVDYRYWKNKKEEKEQLVKVIDKLSREGVDPSDIVILSPLRFKNSVIPEVAGEVDITIADIRDIKGDADGCITYSTIHSFKGMESPVIVLTGITNFEDDKQKSLLYVGMSRARSHLVLVAKESLRKILPDLTRKKLSKEWNE